MTVVTAFISPIIQAFTSKKSLALRGTAFRGLVLFPRSSFQLESIILLAYHRLMYTEVLGRVVPSFDFAKWYPGGDSLRCFHGNSGFQKEAGIWASGESLSAAATYLPVQSEAGEQLLGLTYSNLKFQRDVFSLPSVRNTSRYLL